MPGTPEIGRAGSTRRDPWLLIGVAVVALIARIILVATAPVATRAPSRVAAVDFVHWVAADSAETASAASGKPILYEFSADWCGPCQAMQRDMFADPQIAHAIESYVVPVRVVDRQSEDGRNSSAVDSLQRACKVTGFPTLVLASRGTVIDRQVGYPGPAVTIGWLARAADHTRKPRRT